LTTAGSRGQPSASTNGGAGAKSSDQTGSQVGYVVFGLLVVALIGGLVFFRFR
jgi:hypothetical protein